MAEIRKHNPKITSAIDKALLEAMGEAPRPVPPGQKPPTVSEPKAAPSVTSMPLTAMTWQPPKASPKED